MILTPKYTWENGARILTTFLFHHQTNQTNIHKFQTQTNRTEQNKTSLKLGGRLLCVLLSFLSKTHKITEIYLEYSESLGL